MRKRKRVEESLGGTYGEGEGVQWIDREQRERERGEGEKGEQDKKEKEEGYSEREE